MRADHRIALALFVAAACAGDTHAPRSVPARLEVVTDLPAAGITGASAGVFAVLVSDAGGQPVQGVPVQFIAAVGAGRLAQARDTTGGDGIASTAVTLSTTPGPNQVAAIVARVGQVRSAIATGTLGEALTITFSPRVIWFQPAIDSRAVVAIARDQFGNAIPGTVSWTSRDPGLVSIGETTVTGAELGVVRRPGRTYLVASHGAVTDSVLVAVHDSASSPCDFLATPTGLDVGGSIRFETPGQACVRADGNAEYLVVAHYNTAVTAVSAGVGVVAYGVNAAQPGQGVMNATPVASGAAAPDQSFESELRARERANLHRWVPGARVWYDTRTHMPSTSTPLRVGDLVVVNVNAFDFCAEPTERMARVAALTQGTMILEDTSNPPGGFTPAEYEAIATTVDTLVIPVNVAAFGPPTDIDGNGRIAVLFTRAVNELTPRGAGGVVLGFYYSRDLLPRVSVGGDCPGSNAGEIFYVMVPDPNAVLGDARSKEFVHGIAVGTVAHELQHLINSSRRMYITRAQEVDEEPWLNEGLSHIAEELIFYRASGLAPRQNIGATELAPGTRTREMHDLFMRGNFGRVAQYLADPQSNSALAANDQLATRGAAWAFLRYAADRAGATDGDLWRRLVDGRYVGVANFDAAIASTGMTTLAALRDWTTAIVVDDRLAGASPAFQQPSWNFSTALPAVGYESGPVVFQLLNAQPITLPLRSGGSIHLAFDVEPGREALVQVSTGGGVAQPSMRLTIVRTR